jgi:hypothetical protein
MKLERSTGGSIVIGRGIRLIAGLRKQRRSSNCHRANKTNSKNPPQPGHG